MQLICGTEVGDDLLSSVSALFSECLYACVAADTAGCFCCCLV